MIIFSLLRINFIVIKTIFTYYNDLFVYRKYFSNIEEKLKNVKKSYF